MSDDHTVIHTETANIREDIKDKEHDGVCPDCGTELEMGYGLAGGGMGVYAYCPKCGKVVSKSQDPECE